MNRPTSRDERIRQRAAEILFDRRRDYDVEVDESERDSAIRDLLDVICGYDGYQMARDLEGHGWYANSEMVEWLEGASHDLYTAHNEAVRAWVQAEGITPKLRVGESVEFPTTPYYLDKGHGPTTTGEIASIDQARAQYTVFVPAYGHVREGIGTHGTILDYEKVEMPAAANDRGDA